MWFKQLSMQITLHKRQQRYTQSVCHEAYILKRPLNFCGATLIKSAERLSINQPGVILMSRLLFLSACSVRPSSWCPWLTLITLTVGKTTASLCTEWRTKSLWPNIPLHVPFYKYHVGMLLTLISWSWQYMFMCGVGPIGGICVDSHNKNTINTYVPMCI